jgi:type I restriction enzyme S subunit
MSDFPNRHSREGGNPQNLITEHLDIWTSAIKTKSAAGRGSSKKLELVGIKKLRELILELAVRGKLVPQDPSDEPASELLKKIEVEKTQLVKEGKIKKQKPLAPITGEEKPFELPIGWEWKKLGDLGVVASSSRVLKKDWKQDGVPFYRAREIVQLARLGKAQDDLFISESLFKEFMKSGIFPVLGDIMITGVGTIGVPYIVRPNDRFYFKDASVLIFKNTCALNPQYLSLFMKSPLWINAIHAESMGTTVHTLTISRANDTHVCIPPTAEQHRIVAKVDELMALCDQLEAQTEASIDAHKTLIEVLLATFTDAKDADELNENWQTISQHFDVLFTTQASIDQLKQTILQLAVMGKLVKQDPKDEPASKLLERIATEKQQLIKDGKIKKQKPLPPISDEEKPFELPHGWEWEKLRVITTGMDSGWSPACLANSSPSEDVWGVLKTTAVQVMEYLEFENKELPEKLKPRPVAEVKTGDILFTRAGPMNRVGISCLVQNTRPKLMISDKIIRFHPMEIGIYGRFIALCLNAGATAAYLEDAKSGMAASQVNITQEKLAAAPIPLAPLAQQHRIVTKVDELMALCDSLKANLNQAQTTQHHLTDAIVEQIK